MEPSRDITVLLKIMKALRTPGTGCPWDLEQDFNSIAPYTIEEAYEVADAIEREDMDDLRLELGDLLLQSVYHAQMAAETGAFDFGDVVEGITTKMIRRHPHVFGTEDVTADEYSAAGMAEGTWERIKAAEKEEAAERRRKLGLVAKQKEKSILDDVPGNLPALTKSIKLQKKAGKVGFDWNNSSAVIEKLHEELAELQEAMNTGDQPKIEEELGDLLFTVANLARHLKVDPEHALRGANQKFRQRFNHIESSFNYDVLEIEKASLEELEKRWLKAKESKAVI